MTSRARAFQLQIVGDVNDAKRSLQSLDQKAGKMSKSLGIAGKAMIGAFAAKQVLDFGSAAVKRAEEMGSIYATTAKIIENTGGVANVSSDELRSLNRALSLRTGIDKKLISEGSNVLLTFKGIRNEVGEGNDVFNRANMLAIDMATVFGGDAKQGATQLGKALEDPTKGVGALARVGVTFTDQEKDKIKALQESGDLLGAQRIVLEALEGQVGGTAEASADATAIISNGWREVQEWIGNMILPILAALASYVTTTLLPAFTQAAAWISEKWNAITSMFGSGSNDQISTMVKWGQDLWEVISSTIEAVTAVVSKFIEWGQKIWANYGGSISMIFRGVWDSIKATVDLIFGVLKGLMDFISAVFTGRWGDAFDAIKDIIGHFWDWFKGLPGRIVDVLAGAVGIVGNAAIDLGKAIINGLIGFWNKLDPRIKIGPMPSWIPGLGGKQWTSPDMIPDLPQFAAGGIATSPIAGVFGEAGPEALIPLDRLGGMGGNTIIINAGVGDPVAIGEAVVDAISAYEGSAGSGWRSDTAMGLI